MKENMAFIRHHKFVLIHIMKTDHLLEMYYMINRGKEQNFNPVYT